MAEKWLITGASGQLGGHVLRVLAAEPGRRDVLALAGRGEVLAAAGRIARVGLGDFDSLRAAVREFGPTHIVHTAALSAVADAAADPARAHRINAEATRVLGEAAAARGARLVYTSTDMVFDGQAAPYRETDAPSPLSEYGRSKVAGERALADTPRALVVRVPLLYGMPLTARRTTFGEQIAALRGGRPMTLFTDEFRTPIWLGDAAAALVALARSDRCGLIHVAGPERLSRYALIERFAQLLSVRDAQLIPVSRTSIPAAEPRPADLSLDGSQFLARFAHLAPRPPRREMATS
jgi:dTDP-4-dehydrorhamnose reductase